MKVCRLDRFDRFGRFLKSRRAANGTTSRLLIGKLHSAILGSTFSDLVIEKVVFTAT